LRAEHTLAQMDRLSCELEEMDVEGILAFAERVLRHNPAGFQLLESDVGR
jgi:hypothetical protein